MFVLAGLLLNTPSLRAHHSFTDYDVTTLVTFTGTLAKVDWINPHIGIQIDVRDATGKVTTWSLLGYPPNTLARNGFPRSILKKGETITITVYKAKNGSNTGAVREVTFPDGSRKFAGPEGR